MTKKLILCPGAHKTGTTILQTSLQHNREILLKNNYFVFRRQKFYRSKLWKYLKQNHIANPKTISFQEAKKSMNELLEGYSNSDINIILSIENIFGEFGLVPYSVVSGVLTSLKKIFSDYDIKIIYYIRRQDTFLESMYLQYIHKCNLIEFEHFYCKYKDVDLSWLRILDEVNKFVEIKSINVFCYEDIKKNGLENFIINFYQSIDCSLPNEINTSNPAERGQYTNRSLSSKGLRLALACFPLLDMEERKILIDFLQANFGNNEYPSAKNLSDEQRVYVLNKYLESNRRLFSKYLPNLQNIYSFDVSEKI